MFPLHPPSYFCAENQVPNPCPVETILFASARCWGEAAAPERVGAAGAWHDVIATARAPGMPLADFVLAAEPNCVFQVFDRGMDGTAFLRTRKRSVRAQIDARSGYCA